MAESAQSSPIVCLAWYADWRGKTICTDFKAYEEVGANDWTQNFAISIDDANALTLAICSLILLAYAGGLIGRSMLQI